MEPRGIEVGVSKLNGGIYSGASRNRSWHKQIWIEETKGDMVVANLTD